MVHECARPIRESCRRALACISSSFHCLFMGAFCPTPLGVWPFYPGGFGDGGHLGFVARWRHSSLVISKEGSNFLFSCLLRHRFFVVWCFGWGLVPIGYLRNCGTWPKFRRFSRRFFVIYSRIKPSRLETQKRSGSSSKLCNNVKLHRACTRGVVCLWAPNASLCSVIV